MSKIPLVDLRAQYETIKEEVDAAISGVLSRTSFILGEEVEAFEREFAAYCGAAHCVGCANGTDALELALRAVGVRPGDEVITVANTFIATAEAITSAGGRPVFVDVRDDTLLMDVSKIEDAITPRTRALLPVHLFGQMVDMDPLLEIARRRGLRVVEDCAQAHGARYRGRRAGSFGDAAAFSFYPGKNLGAYGDAGAVVTNDASIAAWLSKARNHGRASKYEHDFEARNSRMDGLQGAVLRVKLRHLDAWTARRRQLAASYREHFRSAVRMVLESDCGEAVYHLFVVRLSRRDEALRRLKGSGIDAGIHYPVPLHLQRAYSHLEMPRGMLPVTEHAADQILSLPLYPELATAAVEMVSRECLKLIA